MSHLIIKPYDKVITPRFGKFSETWHHENIFPTTGDVIEKDGSNVREIFQPIVTAGIKPDFEQGALCTVSDELAEYMQANPLTDWKYILADLRAVNLGVIPLHVAKSGYMPHQNEVLFSAMVKAAQTVLGDAFEIATVGTLGAFSQFFVSIAIKGESNVTIANDSWELFFNLISSHNSLVASQIMQSAVRIVCMNTVQFSIGDAEKRGSTMKIKHTKNSEELITAESFASNLATWQAEKTTLKAQLEQASKTTMNATAFRSFATGVFTNEGSDKLSTTSYNRVENMVPVFTKGRGNKGETLYDGINAFTEYFTSGQGVGGSSVRASKRLASANFGRGNDWKREALRVASDEETYKATMERGERLYSEYALLS